MQGAHVRIAPLNFAAALHVRVPELGIELEGGRYASSRPSCVW